MTSSVIHRRGLSERPASSSRRSIQIGDSRNKFRGSQAIVVKKDILPSDLLTAKDCLDEIHHHLHQKIAACFQQFIVCFNSPDLEFFIGDTIDQFGKGKKAGMKTATSGAHFSTIPTIIARDKKELAAYREDPKNNPKPKKYIYLRGSHYSHTQNSTDILPVFINHADSCVDGSKKTSKLRRATIGLINEVSLGTLSPEKALSVFVNTLQVTIEKKLAKIEKKLSEMGQSSESSENIDPNKITPLLPRPQKVITLEIYLEESKRIANELENNPLFFDYLLGVKTNNDEALRALLFPKRYAMIKQSQIIEAEISKLICQGRAQMPEFKKEKAIKYVIKQNQDNPAFLRLFCKPSSYAEVELKLTADEKEQLKTMSAQISSEITKLKEFELHYRSSLLSTLRTQWKKWPQRKLAMAFNKLYPESPISRSTVSRLENTRPKTIEGYSTPIKDRFIDLNLEWASKLAVTFGVDLGIWRMGFVSESC